MVTEDYISFETAKLLKEKGFDGKCARVWVEEKGNEPIRMGMSSFVEGEEVADNETVEAATGYVNEYMFKNPCIAYLCPTLQMAMKWLREEHKKFIDVYSYSATYFDYIHGWSFIIRPLRYIEGIGWNFYDSYETVTASEASDDHVYPTYEDACDAAIKWCLEKLV